MGLNVVHHSFGALLKCKWHLKILKVATYLVDGTLVGTANCQACHAFAVVCGSQDTLVEGHNVHGHNIPLE